MAKVKTPRRKIDQYLMPAPAGRSEAEIYASLRDHIVKAKCSAKRDHQCCGQITIDRSHITLNCKLCGDLRQTLA